ncbi:MAG: hypothetical protein M0Q88_02865 [Bacilli bacterium]|nr:hypothetical protein [Bacilli bacterium]
MIKYSVIVKVLLWEREGHGNVAHLLLSNSNEHQVDLETLWFNELPVLTFITETRVNTLEDVYKYCRENNIILQKDFLGLRVGFYKDFKIGEDLSLIDMKRLHSPKITA